MIDDVWRRLIEELEPAAVFAEPARAGDLEGAASALGAPLPRQIVALLRESNGVTGAFGLGLIWDLGRIVQTNVDFRRNEQFADLYMPFEPLLFFGDAGNGDQFALLSPPVDRDDVFAWDHENDSRAWVAPDLATYVHWWLTGKIAL